MVLRMCVKCFLRILKLKYNLIKLLLLFTGLFAIIILLITNEFDNIQTRWTNRDKNDNDELDIARLVTETLSQPIFEGRDPIQRPLVEEIDVVVDNYSVIVQNETEQIVENEQEIPNDKDISPKRLYENLPCFQRLISNKLSDPDAIGEQGKGYKVDVSQLTEEEKRLYDEGFENHGVNTFASDKISLQRSIKGIKDSLCNHVPLDVGGLDTSVIIIMFNEALSPLLRTVYSVINRTPPELLKDVIIVDDYSELEELQEPLQQYIEDHFPPKVRLLRTPKRIGLMNARVYGLKAASGQTFTFLDSHCECTHGWLEPLLTRVAINKTNVAMPIIPSIIHDTFELREDRGLHSALGGFGWDLHFKWFSPSKREYERRKNKTDPFWSPTMAGCIFTIHKDFFERLGYYDPEMFLYGAENMEISFKIWMCYGKLELVPCSQIGHVYRPTTPYLRKNNTIAYRHDARNKMRLSEVWMDDYKYYVYEALNYLVIEYGDITERIQLRESLKCHNFEWYLKNIYPEAYVPMNHTAGGKIKSLYNKHCLDAKGFINGFQRYNDVEPTLSVGTVECERGHVPARSQTLALITETKRIQVAHYCLTYIDENLNFTPCDYIDTDERWSYEEDNSIVHQASGKCLDLDPPLGKAYLNDCNGGPNQKWDWHRDTRRKNIYYIP